MAVVYQARKQVNRVTEENGQYILKKCKNQAKIWKKKP